MKKKPELLNIDIINCGMIIFKMTFDNNVPKDIKSLMLEDFADIKLCIKNHLDRSNEFILPSFIDNNVIYIYMGSSVLDQSNSNHVKVFKFFKDFYC